MHRAFVLILLLLSSAGSAQELTWLDMRAAIEQHVTAEDFESALRLTEAFLDGVKDSFGDPSMMLAESRLLVADVYRHDGNLLEAEIHFVAGIDTLVALEGPFTTSLIQPYTQLGEAYFGAGEFELALVSFQEAQAIGRREYGLLNQEQLELLERMSLAALSLGDFDRARDFQEDKANVARRHYGTRSLEALEASFDYAEWLADLGDYQEARYVHIDIQDTIDDYFDEDPKLTIKRLRMASDHLPTFGVIGANAQPVSLNQALKLVEDLDPPDPELHAGILLDLGDWYLERGQYDSQEYYEDTWHMLGSVDGGDAIREQWFSGLTVVRSGPLVSRYLTVDEFAPDGFVELEFTIDAFGLARDIEVVAAEPPELLNAAAIRQIANSRFRPQMENGKTIPVRSSFTWRFRYATEPEEETAATDIETGD